MLLSVCFRVFLFLCIFVLIALASVRRDTRAVRTPWFACFAKGRARCAEWVVRELALSQIVANGLKFEVESLGRPDDPAVLLIMGLGMQLTSWPMEFCQALLAAGFRVIRFDNRDIGLSEKIAAQHRDNIAVAALRYALRLPVQSAYKVEDMAADAVAILDALGIRAAHLVGASMGGMIAQCIAATHPERCLSLTSIMSTSGSRRLPRASLRVTRHSLARPASNAPLERIVEHYVKLFQVIGSPGFPTPVEDLRTRMAANLKRSYHPRGTERQLLAIIASGDRSASLRKIRAPTLVIHGDCDPLVPVAHGKDCAAKIPDAKLEIVPGMGHDLAPGLLPILIDSLLAHLRAVAAMNAAGRAA